MDDSPAVLNILGSILSLEAICSAGATIRWTRQSPRAQGKEGRKNYQRRVQKVPKIFKEGCKTYQNWPTRGENLNNKDILNEKKGE